MRTPNESRDYWTRVFSGDVPLGMKEAFAEVHGEPFDRPVEQNSTLLDMSRPIMVWLVTGSATFPMWPVVTTDYDVVSRVWRFSGEKPAPDVARHKALPVRCLELPSAACFMKGR